MIFASDCCLRDLLPALAATTCITTATIGTACTYPCAISVLHAADVKCITRDTFGIDKFLHGTFTPFLQFPYVKTLNISRSFEPRICDMFYA